MNNIRYIYQVGSSEELEDLESRIKLLDEHVTFQFEQIGTTSVSGSSKIIVRRNDRRLRTGEIEYVTNLDPLNILINTIQFSDEGIKKVAESKSLFCRLVTCPDHLQLCLDKYRYIIQYKLE